MRRASRLALTAAASIAATSAAMGADDASRQAAAPLGALSCSGCHAVRASGQEMLPRLAGRPAAETIAAFAAFRSGERPATLMNRIAKGFTDDESRAIAVWLEAQR